MQIAMAERLGFGGKCTEQVLNLGLKIRIAKGQRFGDRRNFDIPRKKATSAFSSAETIDNSEPRNAVRA